jgi:hypothetical protein
MLKLSIDQMSEAIRTARQISELEAAKDVPGPHMLLVGLSLVPVKQAAVLSGIEVELEALYCRLAEFGIELVPPGADNR